MNERIKELLKKATRRVDREDREWVFSEVDQKKFAQLIVRECADIVKYYHTRNEAVTPQQILQHFGVEE
jgi:hypothetical protein